MTALKTITPEQQKAEDLAKKHQRESEELEKELRKPVDKITADTAKAEGIPKGAKTKKK